MVEDLNLPKELRKKPKFIEAHGLPENEKVYLMKGFDGWRVIKPARDPETNKIIWFNALFGGKSGLIKTMTYVFIALMIYGGVNQLISSYRDAAENPCKYCRLAQGLNPDIQKQLSLTGGINLSNTKNITLGNGESEEDT